MPEVLRNRGNVLSCIETYQENLKPIFDDSDIGFCKDVLSQNFNAILSNFGVLCLSGNLIKDREKVGERAERIIREILNISLSNNNFSLIDNGFYSIFSGTFNVDPDRLFALADMYSTFVSNMADFPQNRYLFLDANTVKGISTDLSESLMSYFLKETVRKCKEKNNDQGQYVHFVYHCNNPIAYKSFINFYNKYEPTKKLGSHRYSVGGMVTLPFNKADIMIRTYIYPLFEVINNEREYLNNGGHVYYHVLGVSSIYDQLLLLMIQKYFDSIGWNLDISADASTCLSMPVRSRTLFHVNKDTQKITTVSLKKPDLHLIPNMSEPGLTNEYYIQDLIKTINNNMPIKEDLKLDSDNIDSFFDISKTGKHKNSITAVHYSVTYSYYSFDQMYKLLVDIVNNSDIEEENQRLDMVMNLMNKTSQPIKNFNRFYKNIFRNINNSFILIQNFVNNKVKIDDIRNQGIAEVFRFKDIIGYQSEILL